MSADESPRDERSFSQAVSDGVMAVIIAQGLSVREVSRRTGISSTRLHGRLAGDYPFNTDELDTIARMLGVEPASFISQ